MLLLDSVFNHKTYKVLNGGWKFVSPYIKNGFNQESVNLYRPLPCDIYFEISTYQEMTRRKGGYEKWRPAKVDELSDFEKLNIFSLLPWRFQTTFLNEVWLLKRLIKGTVVRKVVALTKQGWRTELKVASLFYSSLPI